MGEDVKTEMTARSSKEIAEEMTVLLRKKGAFDLKLYHVEETTSIADYYVIATGRSNTHIRSLEGDLCYQMELSGITPLHTEGKEGGTWILVDFGAVIVHIFSRDARDYYKLERLLPENTEEDIGALLLKADEESKA